VEDKISGFEAKTDSKLKTELLLKKLKSYERNIQELSKSIKRPNLRIIGIKEGKEVEAKGIHNIFNKIMGKNFPNVKKVLPV
jgi:hypothetical protein